MRSATAKVILLSGALLLACQHRPTIKYPKLPVAGTVEAGFDCEKLDDAVLRTEAVRWLMRHDGARLISPEERAARTAVSLEPPGGSPESVPTGPVLYTAALLAP